MDGNRFDALTATLGSRTPRRSLVSVLAISAMALPVASVEARRKKRKKKTCKPPARKCGKLCLEVLSDPANCGSCGRVCAAGEGCVDGTCTLQCPPGQNPCDAECISENSCCANSECDSTGECTVAACLENTCTVLNRPDATSCELGECRNGACTTCIARRDACLGDSQCCGYTLGGIYCLSNLHVDRIACSDEGLHCCGFWRTSCEGDCDCCGGFECRGGQCCGSVGTICGISSDCCSGSCVSSLCA